MYGRKTCFKSCFSFLFLIVLFLALFLSGPAMAADPPVPTTYEVTLTWDANSEPDLSHYVVYWGTSTRNYTNNSGPIGLVTEYKLAGLKYGEKLFFAVTAVDTENLESDYSNEVSSDGFSGVKPKPPTGLGGVGIYISKIVINFSDGSSVEVKRP